jgi:hypothetical protein
MSLHSQKIETDGDDQIQRWEMFLDISKLAFWLYKDKINGLTQNKLTILFLGMLSEYICNTNPINNQWSKF